jgi:murein DD-endopeptidase MepM/ murein hydrolase activator NlpD
VKKLVAVAVLIGLACLAPVLLPLAMVGMVVLPFTSTGSGTDCWSGGEIAVTAATGVVDVQGYTAEQVTNAQVILDVGAERNVSARGQTIAVMTALGESSLRNLTYGDDIHGVRNPDGTPTSSVGLFQQQAWYGTAVQRLDPRYAAGRFYDDLLAVPGWQAMEPTIAAHRAQRNANPYHYERYWGPAVDLVNTLAGYDVTGLTQDAALSPCALATAGIGVTAAGWANPVTGQVTSKFGARHTGIPGASTNHAGIDLAADCLTPVFAAADGIVVDAGRVDGMGNRIRIDHGGGITTTYAHLMSGTLRVSPGDTVTGGTHIASMGGDKNLDPLGAGTSSGCHLHFEVRINDTATDPAAFMDERDITLGSTDSRLS